LKVSVLVWDLHFVYVVIFVLKVAVCQPFSSPYCLLVSVKYHIRYSITVQTELLVVLSLIPHHNAVAIAIASIRAVANVNK
jgi:hypothetical protein